MAEIAYLYSEIEHYEVEENFPAVKYYYLKGESDEDQKLLNTRYIGSTVI